MNIALGPNAGPLGRTPLGGRNWEGFSVDPYLAGQLNAKTIVGMQNAGVMANLKVYLSLYNQFNPNLEPSAEVGRVCLVQIEVHDTVSLRTKIPKRNHDDDSCTSFRLKGQNATE